MNPLGHLRRKRVSPGPTGSCLAAWQCALACSLMMSSFYTPTRQRHDGREALSQQTRMASLDSHHCHTLPSRYLLIVPHRALARGDHGRGRGKGGPGARGTPLQRLPRQRVHDGLAQQQVGQRGVGCQVGQQLGRGRAARCLRRQQLRLPRLQRVGTS